MCNSGYLRNKVFISFIVPVYNACKTLRRCVDSLRNQGLTEEDYEIILVNDGSTDGSGALCEDLSAGHLNTRILTQKNGGLSVARNAGIRMARGEYICFVDADDCLIPGGIRPLLAYCDEGIALVRYWCEIVCPGTSSNQGKADGQIYFRGRGKDYVKRYGLETFCWNYLYRRAFIESSQLFFTPGLLGEDFYGRSSDGRSCGHRLSLLYQSEQPFNGSFSRAFPPLGGVLIVRIVPDPDQDRAVPDRRTVPVYFLPGISGRPTACPFLPDSHIAVHDNGFQVYSASVYGGRPVALEVKSRRKESAFGPGYDSLADSCTFPVSGRVLVVYSFFSAMDLSQA